MNRSEHGRGANEFINFLEYKGVNCYITSGSSCFLKCIRFVSKKHFSMEYISNSYNHIKEELMLRFDVDYQNFVNDIK